MKAYVQVGSLTEAVTGKVCRLSNDYDEYLAYDRFDKHQYGPYDLYEWIGIDGGNITISHKPGWYLTSGGFTLEFQCAKINPEDLLTCDVSDSIFGEVNYISSRSLAYGSFDERNIITRTDVPEADCATVRLSDILIIRQGDFF